MSGEAFPRSNRLARRADFRKTYGEGKKLSGRFLVLFIRPNHLDTIRFGVTVTKRVGSSAVRNKVRRRLRELFRREARADLVRNRWSGSDLVVNLRDGAAKAEIRELREDFARLVRRLGERSA